jgi:hypothetical protein
MPTVRRDGCLATIGNYMYFAGGSNGPLTGPAPAGMPFAPSSNEFTFEKFNGCVCG